MPVLVILGVAVAILGAVVLLLLPNRPGGEFEFKGVTMRSPAAGLPLILAGLISVGVGTGGPASSKGDEATPSTTSSTTSPQAIPPPNPRPRPGPTSPSATSSSTSSSSSTTTTTLRAGLTLSQPSGTRGTNLTVTGGGFWPNEPVAITLRDRLLTKVKANPGGGFTDVPVEIPQDFRNGCACEIRATGESSARHYERPFEVR